MIIGVRGCPHHGMDCCDYDDEEYFYSDDEYYDYTDEESEDEFLDSIAHRSVEKNLLIYSCSCTT